MIISVWCENEDAVIPANAYMDVGGRATQEAKAEAEKWCRDAPFTERRMQTQFNNVPPDRRTLLLDSGSSPV